MQKETAARAMLSFVKQASKEHNQFQRIKNSRFGTVFAADSKESNRKKSMKALLHFLFPATRYTRRESALLLALRLTAGGLLLSHGLVKIAQAGTLASTFPDPIGIGSTASLALAIFAEAGCAVGCIVGFCYRLALIPMICTMGVALLGVHRGDLFGGGELAFVYFMLFILLFIAGPGEWAADSRIARRWSR